MKKTAFSLVIAALSMASPASAVMATGFHGTHVVVTPNYTAEVGVLCEVIRIYTLSPCDC